MSFEAEYLVTTKWDLTAKLYLGPMAQDLKVKYHLLVTKYSASGDLSIQSWKSSSSKLEKKVEVFFEKLLR